MIEKTLAELTLKITDGKQGDCRGKDDSGFYFISCKDVRDGQIHYEDARQIIEEDFWDTHKRTRLEPEDILVTNSGTIGRMAFIRDVPLTYRTTFQKSVAIVKPDKSKIFPKYLYYQLQNCVDGFVNQSNGAAQKNLLLSTMRAFKMNIHEDEDTQIRIASILSVYDDLIENNQEQIKLLEEAAQRLYKEWFVDLRFPGHETTSITDGIPEGWKKERLIDIVKVQYGYAFDGSLFNANGNGTPIVRIRNIPAGTTADYTIEDADPQYVVHNGDILVGMDGEFHINSWSGPDAYLVQRTCSFRPSNPNMKGYLLQAIYEPIKYFESTVVGATVAHLGKKHIDTITVITCPDELYVPFQQYFERRQLLLNQNRLLAESRDRLLPKLMNGEIEV